MRIFSQSYTNKDTNEPAKSIELKAVDDLKEWLEPCQYKMSKHKYPHCFKIKLDQKSEKAVVRYKNWSSDEQWEEAISRDDDNPWFLHTVPNPDQIQVAPTQYFRMLGVEKDNCDNESPVIESIRSCYSIFKNEAVNEKWESWIETALKYQGEEIEQSGMARPISQTGYLNKILNVEQPELPIPELLPEEEPIPQVVFGKVNKRFLCKSRRDDVLELKYAVGQLVILDIRTVRQFNQIGKILSLTDQLAHILWYDGKPATMWNIFKKREGRVMVEQEDHIDRSDIISNGFDLTKGFKLPGKVKEKLVEWNDYYSTLE